MLRSTPMLTNELHSTNKSTNHVYSNQLYEQNCKAGIATMFVRVWLKDIKARVSIAKAEMVEEMLCVILLCQVMLCNHLKVYADNTTLTMLSELTSGSQLWSQNCVVRIWNQDDDILIAQPTRPAFSRDVVTCDTSPRWINRRMERDNTWEDKQTAQCLLKTMILSTETVFINDQVLWGKFVW